MSLQATDPVSAADDQLLARQTIHAAARANGLRVSFAPLITSAGVGQGWHIHSSVSRDGRNLLAGGRGGVGGPDSEGAGWVAGLLRSLPAITAVTTPSVPSQIRLRPGYFAGAYTFWGVENREATLRYVPGGELLGPDAANVELKACDASANPYLALTAVVAAGLAGIRDGLELPDPIDEDPGGWTEERRAQARVLPLPTDLAAQEAALTARARSRTHSARSASARSSPRGAATRPGRRTASSTRSSPRTCGATEPARVPRAGSRRPAAVRRALRGVLGRGGTAHCGVPRDPGGGCGRRRQRAGAAGLAVVAAARRARPAAGRRAAGRRARRACGHVRARRCARDLQLSGGRLSAVPATGEWTRGASARPARRSRGAGDRQRPHRRALGSGDRRRAGRRTTWRPAPTRDPRTRGAWATSSPSPS